MTQRRVATPVSDTDTVYSPDTYVRGMPYEALARLRYSTPVAWIDEKPIGARPQGPGFWAVFRHADACQVLRSPKLFPPDQDSPGGHDTADPGRRRRVGSPSAPVRSRLRRQSAPALTPRALARLADRVERRAYALVDAVTEKGEADFATEIAADLPLLALADLFGVPESDRWLLSDWANRMTGPSDLPYPTSTTFAPADATDMARRAIAVRPDEPADPRAGADLPDLHAYARELGEYKRRHPGDDVMTALVHQADDKGGRSAADGFESLFRSFAFAGGQAVQCGLAGGMVALLKNPDETARLCADPDLLDLAVEEMLRWWSPVMCVRRTAATDTVVGNVPVRKGERVVVWFSSANRDELVFAEPARFDVGRAPNDHLAFGHRPAHCVGAHLVRIQMHAMFAAVLDRFDDLEPAGEARRLRSNVHNGITHLPIRWRPRSPG